MWRSIAVSVICLAPGFAQAAENCQIIDEQIFEPQNKTVDLVSRDPGDASASLIVFKSRLAVNTDGSPNSYHPHDLTGTQRAINNIANGATVRDSSGKIVSYAETLRLFAEFRDNNWVVPEGYRVHWSSVIAGRKDGNRTVPCVFSGGENQGFFGSLTSLKNGLPAELAGECSVNNQLDQRYIPALVIAGGKNPLRTYGATLGDLVVAVNPQSGVLQTAIIGDEGPPDNLGEGSVALNLALLNKVEQPKNYSEAKRLDTGQTEIIVAVIPQTSAYSLERPFNKSNIRKRVDSWVAQQGYGTLESFSAFLRSCASQL